VAKSQPNIKSYAKFLESKGVAILGYGSQGRAQALNLRDSGIMPIIGLPSRSKSRQKAHADGFKAMTPQAAIRRADIVAVLAPDHKHQELFESLPVDILDGKSLLFTHGFSVAFGLVKPPLSCDVILVAPHGPGIRLREMYLKRQSFTAFWAIENDHSGQASRIGLAYAAAIGCPPSNLFKSTFRDEAIGDVFGEQAVLCGGLVRLIEAGFETLVRHGLSPESAYLECVYQIDLIVDLVKKYGPAGMFDRISITAAYGSLRIKKRLSPPNAEMDKLYREVATGLFARDLMNESRKGMVSLRRLSGQCRQSILQRTHDKLSKKLKS
jgi:ketol-acid reductoisomerase